MKTSLIATGLSLLIGSSLCAGVTPNICQPATRAKTNLNEGTRICASHSHCKPEEGNQNILNCGQHTRLYCDVNYSHSPDPQWIINEAKNVFTCTGPH